MGNKTRLHHCKTESNDPLKAFPWQKPTCMKQLLQLITGN